MKIDEEEELILEIAHGEDVIINVSHEVLSDDLRSDQCNDEDDLDMDQDDDICHGNEAKLKNAQKHCDKEQ